MSTFKKRAMITEGATCVSVRVCVHNSDALPVCLSLCLIEIHRRNLNEIQMRFIANCSSSGNIQIDLMMIQCISPSNESLIRPLAEIIIEVREGCSAKMGRCFLFSTCLRNLFKNTFK